MADIKKSVESFKNLGWVCNGEIIKDSSRSVNLAFLKRRNSNEILELVSPINEKSPVFDMLNANKNVALPYHICYEVKDIDKTVEILKSRKYVLVEKPKPAIAFQHRQVAFLLNRDSGLLELLEERK